MLWLIERVYPRIIQDVGAIGRRVASSVDWVMVVCPKFSTAPPPLPPAVFPLKVLSLIESLVSLSMAPPPGPLLDTNVSPATVSLPAR